jgi:hypothetical protein
MTPNEKWSRQSSHLLLALRLAAILIGAAHAAISVRDHMMNEDGIQYLDLGDRYATGQWSPVNSVWSPLYPLLLGLAVRIARPGPRWEFMVAHLLTLALFVVALACFEFFWGSVQRQVREEVHAAGDAPIILPGWAWWASGYALFVWSSVVLIRFRAVTPDMLLAALVYLAAGFLVRIASNRAHARDHLGLGGVLGLAYLAKAVMFPVGILFLGAAAWLHRRRRRALRTWLVAPAAFLALAGPLVLALSMQKGRLSTGDAGSFTYLKHVNGLAYPYRTGQIPAALGTPVHPIRRVHESPAVYEFSAPVPGTYPLGYDPSYWTEGLSPRLAPRQQLRVLAGSAVFYAGLFLREQGGALAVLLLLLWLGRETWGRALAARWPLALIGLAAGALGLYAVVYTEGRYVAPFVVMIWGGLLSLVRLPGSKHAWRALAAAGVLVPALIVVEIAAFDARYVTSPAAFVRQWRAAAQRMDSPWRIAEAVHGLGIRHGAPIGFIGYSYGATFARLARVRIVAEMATEEADQFWESAPEHRDEVFDSFRRAGAAAVITEVPPPAASRAGWTELGRSGRYALLLEPGAAGPQPGRFTTERVR